MNPPPNPHAAEASAACREAFQAAGVLRSDAPAKPAPLAEADAALIEAVLARWPDMRPYAETAEVVTVQSLLCGTVKRRVTVTVWESTCSVESVELHSDNQKI